MPQGTVIPSNPKLLKASAAPTAKQKKPTSTTAKAVAPPAAKKKGK